MWESARVVGAMSDAAGQELPTGARQGSPPKTGEDDGRAANGLSAMVGSAGLEPATYGL